MIDVANLRPGNVIAITRMVGDHGDEVDLASEHGDDTPPEAIKTVYGIVLDGENMMVFSHMDQRGYPGAKGATWVSRVYPTNWVDPETTIMADEHQVPDTIPNEFWPIAAQAGLNGGV